MKLKRVSVDELKDLEPLVVKHIEEIEEGMSVLDHQLTFDDTGRPDILAVDKEGALSILELKSVEADIDVLSQILRYLEWATLNVALVARAFPKVKPDAPIRLFIVAPSFSDDLVRIIKYMQADLTLVRATCVRGSDAADIGVLLERVEIEEAPDQSVPMRSVEDIVGYIADVKVKKVLQKIIDDLAKLKVQTVPYKGGRWLWLECRYKDREIGYFQTRRQFIRCQYYSVRDEDFIWPPVRFDNLKTWETKLKGHFLKYMKEIDEEA